MSGAQRLEIKRSRPLAAVLIVAHGAAAAAACAVVPGPTGLVLAGMLLLLGAAAAWSRALHAAPGSLRAIEVGGAEAMVELAGGERFVAGVAPRRYVSRYLVALPLTIPFRRTLLVTADMLGPEEFRRLRIWALWNRLPPGGGVAAKQLAG